MKLLNKLRQLLRPAATAAVAATTPEVVSLDEQLLGQFAQQMVEQYPELTLTRQGQQLLIEPLAWRLEAAVLERTPHPDAVVLTLGLRLTHADYFPAGIVEYMAGIGTDDVQAVQRGAEVYLEGVFDVLREAQEGRHQPELDVRAATGEVLWHPLLSTMHVQGAWSQHVEQLDEKALFELLRPALLPQLTPQPFHWLKLYASRLPDGEFVGECKLDNEPWEPGLELLRAASAQWSFGGEFAAQKQFLVFRLCGGAGASCGH